MATNDRPALLATMYGLGVTATDLMLMTGESAATIGALLDPQSTAEVPREVWRALLDAQDEQDAAIDEFEASLNAVLQETGEYPDVIMLPWWASEADHARAGLDGTARQANMTQLRASWMYADYGVPVRWYDAARGWEDADGPERRPRMRLVE